MDNFFKDIFRDLEIKYWACEKITRKPGAKLTFLSLKDGQRFLSLRGQIKDSLGRWVLSPGSTPLPFQSRPLYCSLSDRVNKLALRGLEMEKKTGVEHNAYSTKYKGSPYTNDDLNIACIFHIDRVCDHSIQRKVYRMRDNYNAASRHLLLYSRSCRI